MPELGSRGHNRTITVMVAVDTFALVADRIERLFSFGRHVSVAQRRTKAHMPPDLHVGAQLRALERHDDGAGNARLSLVLSSSMLPVFEFSTNPDRCPTHADVWSRWDAGQRTNMTRIQIEGGLPGDSPSLRDGIIVWTWPSSGHCIETVIGFDLHTGPHAPASDADDLVLAGGVR